MDIIITAYYLDVSLRQNLYICSVRLNFIVALAGKDLIEQNKNPDLIFPVLSLVSVRTASPSTWQWV